MNGRTNTHSGGGRGDGRLSWIITGSCFAIVIAVFAVTPGALNLGALGQVRLKAPDITPLLAMSWLVQLHIATVMIALVFGPIQFAMPKGTRAHRVLGWTWVSAMFITAVVTLFIRDMRDGALSPIHIFSVMTLLGVPIAVWQARQGNIRSHTRAMAGLYIGLVIAGVTAIAPGRLIWDMFFT